MDEIEWVKIFKKIFKVFSIFVFVIAIVILGIGLISYASDGDKGNLLSTIQGLFTFIVYTNILLIIIFCIPYITIKLNNIKFNIDFNKEYTRELKNEYSPAIVSLIYDLKTEVYRDYTSTILGLYIKKYIDISGFDEEIVITKGAKQDMQNLLKHEVYVYNCVINKEKFDELKFKEFIIEDAIEKELITTRQQNKKSLNTQLLLIVGLFSFVMAAVSKSEVIRKIFSTCVFILILLPLIWIIKNGFESFTGAIGNEDRYKITSKGKQELKKIKAFKKFIKDYTLIKEKDIEHIQILEEYIPYSLSLGASPQVEEYIKQNEIYRNLIYKGRKN